MGFLVRNKVWAGAVVAVCGLIVGLVVLFQSYNYNNLIVDQAGWYVAPNGNDTYTGTFERPFASLAHAVEQLEKTGGTIYVRGGTYRFTQALEIDRQSGDANWLKITPYAQEQVQIDCAATPADTPCFILTGSFIEIRGLEITQARKTAITIAEQAQYIRLISNDIHDAAFGAIYTYAQEPEDQKAHLEIRDNTIFQTCLINKPVPMADGAGWPAAILVSHSTYVTITNNVIYENHGEGLIIAGRKVLVEANHVYDNYSVNIYLDNAQEAVVARNFIYSTGKQNFWRYGSPAIGIGLANERESARNALSNNSIINNLVVDGRFAFSYSGYRDDVARGSSGGTSNGLVAHNTFVGGREATLFIDTEQVEHRNLLFANNIFYQTHSGQPLTQLTQTAGIQFMHNLWFGGSTGLNIPSNSYVDPLFQNVGGMEPADYQLRMGSPAIDAGTDAGIQTDFWGQPRPIVLQDRTTSGYDIGAFEIGDEQR